MWTFALERITTNDMLQKRRPDICLLCLANSEVFLHCEMTSYLWRRCLGFMKNLGFALLGCKFGVRDLVR